VKRRNVFVVSECVLNSLFLFPGSQIVLLMPDTSLMLVEVDGN